MQGINISNVMAQAYLGVGKYSVFFFEGSIPADVQSVPFDPTSLVDIRDNCVSSAFNNIPVDVTRNNNSIEFSIDSKPPTVAIADTDKGFSETNTQVPIYRIGYVSEIDLQGQDIDTYSPLLANTIEVSSATNFLELEAVQEKTDRSNDETFNRVGTEGSFVVVDLSEDLKQDYASRTYYYVTETSDDLFIDDNVFPHHLAKVQAENPGVYDNTFLFTVEDTSYDEHNQQVFRRSYEVDLIAGGTQVLSINVVKNNSYVDQTSTPRVSGQEVVDTGLGFMEHDIPDQQIGLLVHGMTLTQNPTYSLQKPRANLSDRYAKVYYRRSTLGRVDVWDPTLNEGAGGWIIGESFAINSEKEAIEFPEPIEVKRYIRVMCLDGMLVGSGWVLVSGDPHFSLMNLSFHTKTSDVVFNETANNVNLEWAIIIPFEDSFDETSAFATGTQSYFDKNNLMPMVICDVGLPESGAAIEVQETNFMSQVRPRITKMNFVFND